MSTPIPTHKPTPKRFKVKFIDNISENHLKISHISCVLFFIFSSNFSLNSLTINLQIQDLSRRKDLTIRGMANPTTMRNSNFKTYGLLSSYRCWYNTVNGGGNQ